MCKHHGVSRFLTFIILQHSTEFWTAWSKMKKHIGKFILDRAVQNAGEVIRSHPVRNPMCKHHGVSRFLTFIILQHSTEFWTAWSKMKKHIGKFILDRAVQNAGEVIRSHPV